MENSRTELCGACCKGSHPIRKSFCESIVCACGAPFFSQIVVESNLPSNRRCLIEIPMAFMEDHGSRLDKTVTLQENEDIHRVKIGGNLWVGFGFEWRDFAQLHNIGIGQVIVFTLVARSQFLVQVYKLGKPSSIATEPQTPANVEAEQSQTALPPLTPKVEDDDDIEVCVAQDWLVAKALRTTTANTTLPSKVKVKKVFSETSSRQPNINVNERQKCGIVPNDSEGMDVSDGIAEASNSSRRKKKFDSESFHEGHSLRGRTRRALRYEHPVLKTPAEDQGGQASPQASIYESSSDSEENGDSDASSASTSDSAWSPRKSHSYRGRKRTAANYAAYSDSNTEDEDEDDEDGDNGVEDDQVLNKIAGKKRSSANGSSSLSLDEISRKRGRPSMRIKPQTGLACADDEMNGTTAGLLVEGYVVKRHGHDWHEPGTKRGRTYVSKRRPVTESEKVKTLERARKVQIKYPSFLKQLHKDSCYRSVKLFPPTPFYRDNMISATKGSYRATLIDEEGKSWQTRICGMKIFWKHFTLDHYLEEDDVVVFELIDPRPESVTFLVHIFRVVDVKVTLTGTAGWAVHYNVVEGTKKQYFEERRRLAQAHGLKKLQKQQKQKQKRKDGSSNTEIVTKFPEFFRGKKKQPLVITEVYKRASTSQGKSRELQKEKHVSDSPNADQLEDQRRSPWRRPTTRNKSREMNQSSGELNTTPTPSKSVGSVKQEIEDAPPLATVGTFIGNAVNFVNTKPSVLELVFGREDSD